MRHQTFDPTWLLSFVLVAATLLSWSQRAAALKPVTHRKITIASCRDADLPTHFCERVGREAYNTDADEWDDLSAHAQRAPGQSTCEAAQRTVERVGALGAELRAALDALATEDEEESAVRVAAALGRALHTIADNCAHQGISNPQHAWYSLAAFCEQADYDPDTEPAAYDCARQQTDAVFDVVAPLIEHAGVTDELDNHSCEPEDPYLYGEQQDPCSEVYLPAPWQACSFLGSAEAWDGVDRRWSGELVGAALLAAFDAGVHASEPPATDLCGGDPSAIDHSNPTPPLDTSEGPQSCGLAHLVCMGKADSAGAADATSAFFADEESPTQTPPTAEASCSVAVIGGRPSPAASQWMLLLGGLGLLAARRRRRR